MVVMKKFSILFVGALSIATPALADNCVIDTTRRTTTCTAKEVAAFLPEWKALIKSFPKTESLMAAAEAIANNDEARQLRQATNNQNLHQQEVVFETQVSEQVADNQARRQAQAENRRFKQALIGAVVAPLAGAVGERIAYGKNGGYYGGYNRSGYYGGGQYINRTQPGRVCSNGTFQPVCP